MHYPTSILYLMSLLPRRKRILPAVLEKQEGKRKRCASEPTSQQRVMSQLSPALAVKKSKISSFSSQVNPIEVVLTTNPLAASATPITRLGISSGTNTEGFNPAPKSFTQSALSSFDHGTQLQLMQNDAISSPIFSVATPLLNRFSAEPKGHSTPTTAGFSSWTGSFCTSTSVSSNPQLLLGSSNSNLTQTPSVTPPNSFNCDTQVRKTLFGNSSDTSEAADPFALSSRSNLPATALEGFSSPESRNNVSTV